MSLISQSYTQNLCYGGQNVLEENICACGVLCSQQSNGTTDDCNPNYQGGIKNICSTKADCIAGGGPPPGCPSGMYQCASGYDFPGSPCNGFVCSAADPGQCPVINGESGQPPIRASSADLSNISLCQVPISTQGSVEIVCKYPQNSFTTITQANNWQNTTWGSYDAEAQNNLNNEILTSVCGMTAESINLQSYCPIDPLTGLKMSNCSRIVLGGDPEGYGQTCSAWCLQNPTACTNAMTSYCNTFRTADCGCVSRSQNMTYQSLVGTGALVVPPKCWWAPCSGSQASPYLIPESVLNSTCPSEVEVCQALVQSADNVNTTINLNNPEFSVQCNNDSGNTSGGLSTWIIILIIAGVILLIIAIIAIVYFLIRGKKK